MDRTPLTLFYAGQPGSGFGWGVANRELIKALTPLCDLKTGADGLWSRLDCPVFLPIADHDLNPLHDIRGKPTLGYCFFEYPLGPRARENARFYDLIFCGSTWCKERLAEIGVTNTEVLIQGVDTDIFKPDPSLRGNDGTIRMFSGGKFEYRKGQDLVLAAFKLLHEKHPQLRLVTAWHNPWPQLYDSMRQSAWIEMPDFFSGKPLPEWPEMLKVILEVNGIPKEKVLMITPCGSIGMAFCMNQTDFGVFPNRCEGGTNLVMMEYAACGKPIMATNGTGHADIFYDLPQALYPNSRTTDCKWEETWPEALAECISCAIDKFSDVTRLAAAYPPYARPWSCPAKQILAAAERLK